MKDIPDSCRGGRRGLQWPLHERALVSFSSSSSWCPTESKFGALGLPPTLPLCLSPTARPPARRPPRTASPRTEPAALAAAHPSAVLAPALTPHLARTGQPRVWARTGLGPKPAQCRLEGYYGRQGTKRHQKGWKGDGVLNPNIEDCVRI